MALEIAASVFEQNDAPAPRRARRVGALRTIIIGAGEAGKTLARDLRRTPEYGLLPLGFLDDNPSAKGPAGIPILGTTLELESIAAAFDVDVAVVAIPSLSPQNIRRLAQSASAATIREQVTLSMETLKLSSSSPPIDTHDPGPEIAGARAAEVVDAAAQPIELPDGGATVRIGTASWSTTPTCACGTPAPGPRWRRDWGRGSRCGTSRTCPSRSAWRGTPPGLPRGSARWARP